MYHRRVYKLVALHFLENPENKPFVDVCLGIQRNSKFSNFLKTYFGKLSTFVFKSLLISISLLSRVIKDNPWCITDNDYGMRAIISQLFQSKFEPEKKFNNKTRQESFAKFSDKLSIIIHYCIQ